MHNEIILAGPEAMGAFLNKFSAEDFESGKLDFSKEYVSAFNIKHEVIDQLSQAYLLFEHVAPEELKILSVTELERMVVNQEVTLLHYETLVPAKCDCGQVVFEGIVGSAVATAGCLSCFGGALPACFGCAYGAAGAYTSLREAWNCGCFSQDMSPYQ